MAPRGRPLTAITPPPAPSSAPPTRKTPNTDASSASPWNRPPARITRHAIVTAHAGPVSAPQAAPVPSERALTVRAAANPA